MWRVCALIDSTHPTTSRPAFTDVPPFRRSPRADRNRDGATNTLASHAADEEELLRIADERRVANQRSPYSVGANVRHADSHYRMHGAAGVITKGPHVHKGKVYVSVKFEGHSPCVRVNPENLRFAAATPGGATGLIDGAAGASAHASKMAAHAKEQEKKQERTAAEHATMKRSLQRTESTRQSTAASAAASGGGGNSDSHDDGADPKGAPGVIGRLAGVATVVGGASANPGGKQKDASGSKSPPSAPANDGKGFGSKKKKEGGRKGYIEMLANSAALIEQATVLIEALPLRDPVFLNIPDERGRLLWLPTEVVLTVDGDKAGMCYLPAVQFCVGSKTIIPRAMKLILSNVSYHQLDDVLLKSKLTMVHEEFKHTYFELLSKTAGMFMLGGKVAKHMHWAGLDCFKGVLYMGNGLVRILDPSDLESRESAKAFFADGGFLHISEVYSIRKLPTKKRKHHA